MKLNCRQIFTLLFSPVFLIVSVGYVEGSPAHVNVDLASAGSSHYVIRCSQQPSDMEQLAVKELQNYLNKISETNFEVLNKQSKNSIVVCQIQSLSKIAPSGSLPKLTGEEYGIFERDGNLYLIGTQGRSVLYAVYDFLNGLGCRWFTPDFKFYGGVNEFVPKNRELSYSQTTDIIRRPAFKYRKLYVEEGLSHNTQNLLQMVNWMPRLHFNTLVIPMNYQGEGRVAWDNWRKELTPELKKRGIMIEVGGHGWQNFLNADMKDGRLFAEHPDWFGMDSKGERSREHNMVFCTSNPDAVAYLHNNLLSYLKGHPEIDIFDFWPPDQERWCECPACKNLGNASDRHAKLVSQTVQLLNKERPNLIIECVAYSRHVQPPQKEILDKSVLLDFCPYEQSFEWQIYENQSKENKAYKENLAIWLKAFQGEISIYSYYRKYAWRSLPNMIPHYMQKDLQFYRDIGVRGISTYAEPGDWFTYGLNHYIFGQLASDPNADVDGMITDYCDKVYGSEAETAKFVYSTLEATVCHACSIPNTKRKSPKEYEQFATKINSCTDRVKAAMGRYASNTIIYAHLHRLYLMLDYTSKDIEIIRLLASGGDKMEAHKKADEIQKLFDENAELGIFIPHYRLVPPKIYKFYKM